MIAAEAGDTDARRRLVEAFLPAIGSVARRFPPGRVERQDLMQEGVAALLFAAHRYDPSLGTPFWGYASFWVRKAMQELIGDLARPVSLSDRAVRDLAHIKTARADFLQAHGAEPSANELGVVTGFTGKQLGNLLATDLIPRGIDEPLGGQDDGGPTVGDAITDPAAEQEYQQVLDSIEIAEVTDLTEQLDARERDVLRAHYGLDQPSRTLSEIGGSLGVTAERARQIESHALHTLREALAASAPVPTLLT